MEGEREREREKALPLRDGSEGRESISDRRKGTRKEEGKR